MPSYYTFYSLGLHEHPKLAKGNEIAEGLHFTCLRVVFGFYDNRAEKAKIK